MSEQIRLMNGPPKLTLDVGRWKMRNGSTVEVESGHVFVGTGPHGQVAVPMWLGHCLCHNAKMSWNLDGSYRAVPGEHEFDIVERADADTD